METRYAGSAIVQDNGTDLLIVIPARKNWLGILYTSVWLCIWLVGELSIFASATSGYGEGFGNPIVLFWFLAWTVGGLFVFRSLLWNLYGKEFIAINQHTLIVEKKGLLLSKPKEYDTSRVRDVRVQQDRGGYVGQFVIRKNLLDAGSDGIIRFDYGQQTVKFAGSIKKADAIAIIQEMKEQRYLTESHFNTTAVEVD